MPRNSYDVSTLFCWVIVGIASIAVFAAVVYLLYRVFKNPYEYPYFEYTFNVTNKKNVRIEDYVERFLCNEYNWASVSRHKRKIDQWKKETEADVKNRILKKYRYSQYKSAVDDKRAYRFTTYRMHKQYSRYGRKYYLQSSEKIAVKDTTYTFGWNWLEAHHKMLEEINFKCSLFDYHCKKQRALMTSELRAKIQERDNYTCKICGKYMPDLKGLVIDHIIPVAKWGKTEESNLRVLCSRCNGIKGSKLDDEL